MAAGHVVDCVRRLTPRECERLQGFPDDWTAGESDAQRYRQLGNAVCVPVAEWLGRRLVPVHRGASPGELWQEAA
jgi:DNA (cytosine-5)-methyltransferase 1